MEQVIKYLILISCNQNKKCELHIQAVEKTLKAFSFVIIFSVLALFWMNQGKLCFQFTHLIAIGFCNRLRIENGNTGEITSHNQEGKLKQEKPVREKYSTFSNGFLSFRYLVYFPLSDPLLYD